MPTMGDTNTLESDATNEDHATTLLIKRYVGVLVEGDRYKIRASMWEHMTKIKFLESRKARCNYCYQE